MGDLSGKEVSPLALVHAVGRRKRSIASVTMKQGKGEIIVNHKSAKDYFKREDLLRVIDTPFKTIKSQISPPQRDPDTAGESAPTETQFDIKAQVNGGGICGQAGALSLGISRALQIFNPDFRKPLKSKGLLTRDQREKERRKCGKRKARKSPQWTKR